MKALKIIISFLIILLTAMAIVYFSYYFTGDPPTILELLKIGLFIFVNALIVIVGVFVFFYVWEKL